MKAVLTTAIMILLASPVLGQDAPETFEESFQRCAEAKSPMVVLVASCTAAIEAERLTDRGLAHALLVRGFALKALNRYESALADYDRSIALDPNFLPALRARADLFAAQRDYDRAIKELDRVIRAEPDRAENYKRRGDFHDWRGDHDAAIADYTLAMTKGAGPQLRAERAAAHANKGEIKEALADLEVAIAKAPDYPVGWFERGRIRFETGNWTGAAEDLARAADLQPEDGFRALWAYLGAARAGNPDAVKMLALRAEVLDLSEWPGPLIEVFLGQRAAEAVDEMDAPAGWERTGRLVEIEFYLGMHDLLRGDRDQARARFKQARDLGITEYVEHRAAEAELVRMNNQK